MANPQPTDAHIRIAHSISEAIMMRDFSKRQRAILDLILRLSWGCGKKTAIIPLKKDFRIIGVAETKIKDELEWLVNANVIEWSKETNEFGFLKDFEKWSVSIVPGYDRKRFDELLHINLTSQNGNLLPKTGTSQNGKKLHEKGRNFPKNQEVEQGANTDNKQVCGQSKKSIKKSNIYTTSDFAPDTVEFQLALQLRDGILRNYPKAKVPDNKDIQKWITTIDRMIRLDNRTPEEISSVIDFALQDSFWRQNILSADALRRQFDKLAAKMGSRQNTEQDRFKDIEI